MNRFWAILLTLTCLTAQALPVGAATPEPKPASCTCNNDCHCPVQPKPCGCTPAPARASWTGITAPAIVIKRASRAQKQRAATTARTAFYTPFLTADAVPARILPRISNAPPGPVPLFREQCRLLI